MAAAHSSAAAASLAGVGAARGGCAVSRPQQLSSSATAARVGTFSLSGGSRAGAGGRQTGQQRRNGVVRCQAIPFFTKLKKAVEGKGKVEDLVGTVQVLKEGVFDVASHILSELMHQKVKLYLVSTELDPDTKEPKISPEADLLFNNKDSKDIGKDAWIQVKFKGVPEDFGKPGALLVESYHENEFFLKSLTLELPKESTAVHFPCHSWIDAIVHYSNRPRIFFANQAFLPKLTPEALVKYREEDLRLLKGDGKGEREKSERIYDYDVYNDLGNSDKSEELKRPTLGGSTDLPYPRRCRTGRSKCKADSIAEKPVTFDDGYVPRDERFSPFKFNLFLTAAVKCFGQQILPVLRDLVDEYKNFSDFDEIHALYEGGLRSIITRQNFFKHPTTGANIIFPPPGVVHASSDAWGTDGEFARQRLAGLNPFCIERVKEFPIKSNLDPEEYGSELSSITKDDLEGYLLEGFKVEEAIEQKRLFILDYHDAIMPYVARINEGVGKTYASRTLFFLSRYNVLLPVVIELSLPPTKKGEKGYRRVFKRPPGDVINWDWRFAKTHVAALDSGIHQLVSHWLRTHACVEPFIIATHRQLSTMHPLHVLLLPHFKDTMNINAMARSTLINADGIIEKGFTPGKYCAEISSVFYKNWRFDEQALPKDLIKRGMAEEDPEAEHGVKLVLDDYPYAKDGLDLWGAIKGWVGDYVGVYYKEDEDVEGDKELQGWWKEVTEEGHGDHKGASWWGEIKKKEELVEALTTLIWVTSGHHSAVNFGQYAYAGYMPNSPTMCEKLIPDPGSKEYDDFTSNPEAYYLAMLASQGQTTLIMATCEILAQHLEDEEYLGQRNDPQWTSDPRALDAFERFNAALQTVDANIKERNEACEKLFHRAGTVLLPYTLLAPLPAEEYGLTFRGVPNSISI